MTHRKCGVVLVVSGLFALAGCEEPAPKVPAGALDAKTTPAVAAKPEPVRVADPQTTLEGARDLAIELTEHRAYKELVTRLVEPSELAKIEAKTGGVDALVEEFASSEKPAELLQMLRAARGATPELKDDGASASFAREGARDLKFRRVDGRWYLKN